ncbi:hypothetical protein CDL15_Pgr013817 [Punica granatum]|uniref:Uncharacterized protein n=1 Tax=Punica granatum TaxID=22663 RepID=A0A218W2R7_PUNGR|nr:hypothetical protein CDL15_Pgr013817 [Punica granatum]
MDVVEVGTLFAQENSPLSEQQAKGEGSRSLIGMLRILLKSDINNDLKQRLIFLSLRYLYQHTLYKDGKPLALVKAEDGHVREVGWTSEDSIINIEHFNPHQLSDFTYPNDMYEILKSNPNCICSSAPGEGTNIRTAFLTIIDQEMLLEWGDNKMLRLLVVVFLTTDRGA